MSGQFDKKQDQSDFWLEHRSAQKIGRDGNLHDIMTPTEIKQ